MKIVALALVLAGCDARPEQVSAETIAPKPPEGKEAFEPRFDFDAEYKALWDAKAPALLRLPEKLPYQASEDSRSAYLEGYQRAVRRVLAARRVDHIVNFTPPSTEQDQARMDGYKDGQSAGFEAERVITHETYELLIRQRRERHK
ncbi:MAG TPA: hypothetical protein VF950_06055 [Planctomycetota bacterium]